MAKKRVIGRYPKAFRKMAVERLKRSDNIVALSHELGVHRRLLYKCGFTIKVRKQVGGAV